MATRLQKKPVSIRWSHGLHISSSQCANKINRPIKFTHGLIFTVSFKQNFTSKVLLIRLFVDNEQKFQCSPRNK